MSEQEDSTKSLVESHPTIEHGIGGSGSKKESDPAADKGEVGDEASTFKIPAKMGRYDVIDLLGRGAFGHVLLANDANLERLVAIKVPRLDRFRSKSSVQNFLEEARTVARLRHRRIVVIYDVGWEDEVPYIVMEYIRGRSLSEYLRQERVSYKDAALLVRQIADALAHAHNEGFVHRDLKPANILLDNEDAPHISDFGLALRHRDSVDLTQRLVGTPDFMAPEQVAGENHRIDERTDLWALGVILYLALSGRKPFSSNSFSKLQEQILAGDYVQLSYVDPKIPPELQRICQRCMSRRMTDRYRYATELVKELDDWLNIARRESETESGVSSGSYGWSNSAGANLIPRGLRAFGPEDAPIFSKLLPGPWDRNGCNSTLRFLKTSIEQSDPEQTFRVGLLYGPSGSGKSSLLQAAVIPRVNRDIKVIQMDAIAGNLEQRLKRALLRQFDRISKQQDLAEMLFTLREEELLGENGKLLIVIDQFEQWLASGQVIADGELVRALRQCDGGKLQCLLTVRDFWLPVCRFMSLLESNIVDGQNACLIDAFDVDHARKVLIELGVAYACLPENRSEITAEQNAFLDRSIAELTEDDRLFPIRLTIFVEMVRAHPWKLSTLDRLGGVGGIGVAFLEHAIGSQASAARQIYTEAARNVLASLLPTRGLIKNPAVKREVLLNASGFKDAPKDFDQLMRLLDNELRLLTPVATDEDLHSSDSSVSSSVSEPCYQLTHDFLIPSVREWLERNMRSTPTGRLQLMLQEQAELWASRPSARYLPSTAEWLQYTLRTNRRDRTESQRKMLRAAGYRIRNKTLIGSAILAVLVCITVLGYQAIHRARLSDQSKVMASALQQIEIREVPQHIDAMQPLWSYAEPLVKQTYQDAGQSVQRRARAAIALLRKDGEPAIQLVKWLLDEELPAENFAVTVDALKPHAALVTDYLTQTLSDHTSPPGRRLRAVAALAVLADPGSKLLSDPLTLSETADTLLRRSYPEAQLWIDLLRPISNQLSGPIERATLKTSDLESTRIGIAAVQAYSRDPLDIMRLLPQATDFQFRAILEVVQNARAQGIQRVNDAFEAHRAQLGTTPPTLQQSQIQVNFALAALILGDSQPIMRLASRNETALGREHLIHLITPSRLSFSQLQRALNDYANQPSLVAALLLAANKYPESTTALQPNDGWLKLLNQLYMTSSDREIHSITGLLLRKQSVDTAAIDKQLSQQDRVPGREWYVDAFGQTMIVFDAQESPNSATRPLYSFAICSKEVTTELFLNYFPDHRLEQGTRSSGTGTPVTQVHKSKIAEFCNLLSRDSNLAESQWCYPSGEDPTSNFVPVADFLKRSGYRLPTVEELNYVILVSKNNPWLRAIDSEIALSYVWSRVNGQNQMRPVAQLLPNPFGMFDVYGNASEMGMELDTNPADPLGVTFSLRGGNVSSIIKLDSTELQVHPTDPQLRDLYGGFRVVQTLPK